MLQLLPEPLINKDGGADLDIPVKTGRKIAVVAALELISVRNATETTIIIAR